LPEYYVGSGNGFIGDTVDDNVLILAECDDISNPYTSWFNPGNLNYITDIDGGTHTPGNNLEIQVDALFTGFLVNFMKRFFSSRFGCA